MLFSQTFGRALEDRPVFSAESSEDKRDKTVPTSALCAPNDDRSRVNYSQLQPLARPSYSPAAQEAGKAFEWPSCAADE
jgi:hypothetical protein